MKTKECESVCYDQIRSDVIDKRDHGQARLLLFQVEVGGAPEQSESHIRSLAWSGYERLMTTSYERASAKVSDSAPTSYAGGHTDNIQDEESRDACPTGACTWEEVTKADG